MGMLEILMEQAGSQWEFIVRILLAGILGAFVGFERKSRNKIAGVRTHAIVALGAALMMVVSKYGFYDMADFDASRVASQIVSGVGFLGVGIIFVRNNSSVSGLTTAAGIWATAGVGMSMGAGQYFISTASAILIIGMQIIMHRIHFIAKEAYEATIKTILKNTDEGVHEIEEFVTQEKIEVISMKINKTDDTITKLELELLFPPGYDKVNFINRLADWENVISVKG